MILVLTAIGLGFGLAMDAFSVSLANGLHEPKMRFRRVMLIAGTFAVFQGVMPMLGWILVTTVVHYFTMLETFIPWIAFGLLAFIGIKMIIEGAKGECVDCECHDRLSLGLLMVQGIATSIDAMSGGVTMANDSYTFAEVMISVAIIASLTFGICIAGIYTGKVFGTKFAGKASIFGGAILLLIGIIILVKFFMGI